MYILTEYAEKGSLKTVRQHELLLEYALMRF